jgi:hypothetical protein
MVFDRLSIGDRDPADTDKRAKPSASLELKVVTVNVSSSTKYSVRGVSPATLDSVAVGYTIQAQGTLNADGSLTATVVQAAPNVRQGFPGSGGGRGFPGFGGGQTPPAPSASPSGSNL